MPLYHSIADEQLVMLLRGSDKFAFTEIYNRYWKLLFYVAFKRLNNMHDAEEVVQEVFVDIWERRESLEITRSLKYYLSAAVQYQVMNRLAKKNNRSLEHIPHRQSVPADQLLLFKELEQQIQEVVDGLPDRCRLVYQLSRIEGLNNREIAAQLDIAEKTVENQLTKAISRIKNGLGLTSWFYIIFCLQDFF